MFEPWQMAALEEYGYTDTSSGLCNRIGRYLAQNGSSNIGNEEFYNACISCGVDPSSITQADLDEIQAVLNRLT